MKKLLFIFLAMALTGTAILAQKTINDPLAEKRSVSGFHGIEVATGIEMILTKGNTEEVAVSAATAEYRDRIMTRVENGILKIYYESKVGAINKRKESKGLKAYVSCKTLTKLNVNTGAEVEISGVLQSASLDLNANTGALVNGEVDIDVLKVSQNTGSKVSLSGRADKLEVDGDTGSKFKGEDLKTSSCNVAVSTGAIASVNAEKELQVRANTGGSVKYRGNASIREINTKTGGSVHKI